MPYVTVQVREEISLDCLCALFWDALVYKLGDNEDGTATQVVMDALSTFCSREAVQAAVRQWLGWYGSRSVECGPRSDWPEDEMFRVRLKAIVAKAYRIVY